MLQIPPLKLKDFLVKDGLIKPQEFDDLSKEANRMGQGLADSLISKGFVSEDYFYNLVARYLGVEMADLAGRQINEEIFKKISEDLARQKKAIIFNRENDGTFDVAMEDPSDLTTIKFLENHLKAKIKPFLAIPGDLDKGFAFYGRRQAEDFKKIIEENIVIGLRNRIGIESSEKAAQDIPIVAIVDNLILYAASSEASDIHIEILENEILVRYRIDGVLYEIIKMSKEIHPAVVARIKLLAGLKIDEHMKPQDGRFRYKTGNAFLDIRVSVIPVFYGEKVEMRLLPAIQKPLSLDEIGMLEDVKAVIEGNVKKTYGMILVTGPTGSGKTTTLYSILNILNRPEVNIVTVEDPIEYEIKYINQVQINPLAGVTFATGLRAILRQDPNVIMVGEIRDEETAEIAVHSALTGHLLLSSLHTNDAATAIPRLMDMKIQPFLAAAVLNVVIAQRLVRKICLSCVESFAVEPALLETLNKSLREANSDAEPRTIKFLYRGRGCRSCGGTGFRGRIGIFEILNVDEEIREFVINPNFSLDGLRNLAKKKGMITMLEDGIRKAELGITTIEEVLKVIRE